LLCCCTFAILCHTLVVYSIIIAIMKSSFQNWEKIATVVSKDSRVSEFLSRAKTENNGLEIAF
jgi:hypothetical protein